ncbi:Hsp20/alpha crystallin family protein [Ostertagia ostertagi]
MMRDFERFKRGMKPYWREADHSVMHVGEEVHPDESLSSRENRIVKTNTIPWKGRSFVRKWTVPDDVNLDAIYSKLNVVGHLSVEAPKRAVEIPPSRTIPIMPSTAPSN